MILLVNLQVVTPTTKTPQPFIDALTLNITQLHATILSWPLRVRQLAL